VDDSETFAGSAIRFLSSHKEIQMVVWAPSANEALEKLAETPSDLVLLDIAMPYMTGLEALPLLKQIQPTARVVFLTLYDNAAYRAEAERIGADGFVGKAEFATKLIPLISKLFREEGVENGKRIVS